jgi:hypothetical protein
VRAPRRRIGCMGLHVLGPPGREGKGERLPALGARSGIGREEGGPHQDPADRRASARKAAATRKRNAGEKAG